jgi:hypothetical protein
MACVISVIALQVYPVRVSVDVQTTVYADPLAMDPKVTGPKVFDADRAPVVFVGILIRVKA